MNDNIYVTAVKIAKGKVELEYVDTKVNRPYTTEEKNQPHPDLFNAVKKLVPFLAQVFYLNNKQEVIDTTGFSKRYDSTLCVIKGMLTTSSGKKVAINSDAIDLEKEVYGFEQDLERIIEEIQTESEQFFFRGKQAQAEINFEEDKEEEVTQDEKNEDIGEYVEEQEEMDNKSKAAGEDNEPDEPELDDTVKEGSGNQPGEPLI